MPIFATDRPILYDPSDAVLGDVTVSVVEAVAPGATVIVELPKVEDHPLGTEA